MGARIGGNSLCIQHECLHCGGKTSDSGMLFRCLGCTESFCPECVPEPDFNIEEGEEERGMFYVDNCKVDEHFRFHLPDSYMYIFCGTECKNYYETDFSKRKVVEFFLCLNVF